MPIVTLLGEVLDRGGVDRDTSALLFGSLVDLSILHVLGQVFLRQNLGDSRGQGSLAMINMAHGTHIHVRTVAHEFGEGLRTGEGEAGARKEG